MIETQLGLSLWSQEIIRDGDTHICPPKPLYGFLLSLSHDLSASVYDLEFGIGGRPFLLYQDKSV